VEVKNLFYTLTEDDLKGLFSRVGQVEFVKIKYNRSGRSEGEARVGFCFFRDADEAVRRFDGKMAAGQEIRVSIAPRNKNGEPESLRDRLTPRRSRPVKKSAEDLDAELDEYMNVQRDVKESRPSSKNGNNENTDETDMIID
jgi:THO complex subunit 4